MLIFTLTYLAWKQTVDRIQWKQIFTGICYSEVCYSDPASSWKSTLSTIKYFVSYMHFWQLGKCPFGNVAFYRLTAGHCLTWNGHYTPDPEILSHFCYEVQICPQKLSYKNWKLKFGRKILATKFGLNSLFMCLNVTILRAVQNGAGLVKDKGSIS